MPRPRVISRQKVATAGLEIIDERGLEDFTLERLADRLGVRAPSLYHHFADRADIMTSVAYGLLAGIELPEPEGDDWKGFFLALTARTRQQMLKHARGARLVFDHFPSTLTFPGHEIGVQMLTIAGVPPDDQFMVIRGLEKLVLGISLADAEDAVLERPAVPDSIEPGRWPAFVSATLANRRDPDELFEQSVLVYLEGIEARYGQSGAERERQEPRG